VLLYKSGVNTGDNRGVNLVAIGFFGTTNTPAFCRAFLFRSGNTTWISKKGLRCCVYGKNWVSGRVSFSREVVRRRYRSKQAASRLTTSRLPPTVLIG
jgi:hypothetical protein